MFLTREYKILCGQFSFKIHGRIKKFFLMENWKEDFVFFH